MDGNTHDAVVVGGGPAGLQAALTLGRMHRRTLLVDSGDYRNGPVTHMHNFLSHDGTPPGQLRARARSELATYDAVTVVDGTVATVAVGDGAAGRSIDVTLGDGERVSARALVLATGLRDELPAIPGLAGVWGTRAFGCPYCHGHELTGRRIGVLGSAPSRGRLALHLSRIGHVEWLVGRGEPDAALLEEAIASGIRVRRGRVVEVAGASDPVAVVLDDGCEVGVDGIFVETTLRQAAPFAGQLGLRLLPSGCVAVDDFGRTSLPGVYAAGDLAHRESMPQPMASVLAAAAAGQLAAATCDQELLAADHPVLAPVPAPRARPQVAADAGPGAAPEVTRR